MRERAVTFEPRYARALAVYQDTSREAWEAFQSHLASTDRTIVQLLRSSGGLYSEAIEEQTGLKHQTVSAQLRHLCEAGIVYATGERARTRSGRKAIVWRVLTPGAPTQGALDLCV